MQSISQVSPVRGHLVRSYMLPRDGFAIFSDGFSRNSTIASSIVIFNMALWFNGSSSYSWFMEGPAGLCANCNFLVIVGCSGGGYWEVCVDD